MSCTLWWCWGGEVVTEDSLKKKKKKKITADKVSSKEKKRSPSFSPSLSSLGFFGVRTESLLLVVTCNIILQQPRRTQRGRPPRLPSNRPHRPLQQLRLILTNLKLSSHSLAPPTRASTGEQRGRGAEGREKSPGKALKCHF